MSSILNNSALCPKLINSSLLITRSNGTYVNDNNVTRRSKIVLIGDLTHSTWQRDRLQVGRTAKSLLAVAVSRRKNNSSSPQVSELAPTFAELISSQAAVEWLVHCLDFQAVSYSHMLTITLWQKQNTSLRHHIGVRRPCTDCLDVHCTIKSNKTAIPSLLDSLRALQKLELTQKCAIRICPFRIGIAKNWLLFDLPHPNVVRAAIMVIFAWIILTVCSML